MSVSRHKKLDTVEAANYLGLGKSTLEKLRINGGGPAYIKINKSVRYEVDDLDAWVAQHKLTSTSESTATVAA